MKRVLYPPIGIALTLALWHWLCIEFKIPTAALPTPAQVFVAAVERWDLLLSEGWVTLKETLYGFLLALGLGIPIAVAVTNSQTLNLMFSPLLIALQSVPKVALAPILWPTEDRWLAAALGGCPPPLGARAGPPAPAVPPR